MDVTPLRILIGFVICFVIWLEAMAIKHADGILPLIIPFFVIYLIAGYCFIEHRDLFSRIIHKKLFTIGKKKRKDFDYKRASELHDIIAMNDERHDAALEELKELTK